MYFNPVTDSWIRIPWDIESSLSISSGLGGKVRGPRRWSNWGLFAGFRPPLQRLTCPRVLSSRFVQPSADYCTLACERFNSPLYGDLNHPQDITFNINPFANGGDAPKYQDAVTQVGLPPGSGMIGLPSKADIQRDLTPSIGPNADITGQPSVVRHSDACAVYPGEETRPRSLHRAERLEGDFQLPVRHRAGLPRLPGHVGPTRVGSTPSLPRISGAFGSPCVHSNRVDPASSFNRYLRRLRSITEYWRLDGDRLAQIITRTYSEPWIAQAARCSASDGGMTCALVCRRDPP